MFAAKLGLVLSMLADSAAADNRCSAQLRGRLAVASSGPSSALLALPLGRNRRRQHQRRDKQVLSTSVITSASFGIASWQVTKRLTTSFTPGGMTWTRMRRPLFSQPQKAAVITSVAALGFAIGGDLSRRQDSIGSTLRSIGDIPIQVCEFLGRGLDEKRRRRERLQREEWLRTHSKPAKIYMRN